MDSINDSSSGWADTPRSASRGRLVLLTTTHRVAPGLLSWTAWQTLRQADRVLVARPDHPQVPHLRDAGVRVEIAALTGRELAAAASPEGRVVVLLTEYDGDLGIAADLAGLADSGELALPEIELLPGSYDLPGARLLDLVEVMNRLRSPGGCPWDAQQTHESLVKYLLEEAYELIETIEDDDRAALREELGDVLLQVMFHARIAEEHPTDPFGIDDVAGGIVEKLVYRHPHVFGSQDAATAADVEVNWERLKAAEKQRDSVTEGVPLGQPALALAAKLASRVHKAGLSVPPAPESPAEPTGPEDAWAGASSAGTAPPPGERAMAGRSPRSPAPAASPGMSETAVGERLLALAVTAARHGIDPEVALRSAARRYRDRILEAERDDRPRAV